MRPALRLLEALGVFRIVKTLRSLSNEALLAAAEASQWAGRSRVSIDGWVLPEPPLARFLNGHAMSVPLMVGSLANEGHELLPRVARHRCCVFSDVFSRGPFADHPDAIPAIQKAYQAEIEVDYATARHEISTDLFMAFSMRLWAGLNQKQGGEELLVFHEPCAAGVSNLSS